MALSDKLAPLIFLITQLIVILACIINIYSYYERPSLEDHENGYVENVIKTIHNIIHDNNKLIFPKLTPSRNYYTDYEALLKMSSNPCRRGTKKCGILDSLGNIMCIPQDDQCPINEAIVDSKSKRADYEAKGYKVDNNKTNGLLSDELLYYTNTKIDKEIVVNISESYSTPRYITDENFYTGGSTYDDDDDDHSLNDVKEPFRRIEFIYPNFAVSEDIFYKGDNIASNYKNISKYLYVNNYIGFEDSETMEKYNDLDLDYLFSNPYPNGVAVGFLFVGIFVLILDIIHTSCKLCCIQKFNKCCENIQPLCANLWLIIPYLLFDLGYFIYTIYCYDKLYVQNDLDSLTDMKVDNLMKTLLKRIDERHESKNYIICSITLFLLSFVLFIISQVIECIINKGCPKNQGNQGYYASPYTS